MAKYVIGIDLGTTNITAAYADLESPKKRIKQLLIPQVLEDGEVKHLPMLPAYCYLADPHEMKTMKSNAWSNQDYFAGIYAKQKGLEVPTKCIRSSKSWLCHSAAFRKDPILPLDTADEKRRISPFEATRRYLCHIKEAWDLQFAKKNPACLFEMQKIILTVPASFEEAARNLTVEAAKQAGYPQITLLEEPQAAFYNWLANHENSSIPKGNIILVCDIGGGTTDFSLILADEKNGNPIFERVAVGDHLLLGGDNMDLAIALHLENRIEIEQNKRLNLKQWNQLVFQACTLKETFLNQKDVYEKSLTLSGTGSKIIGDSLSISVTAEEILRLLKEGFFSPCDLYEEKKKPNALQKFDLPYESESSFPKQMAFFLHQHKVSPDFVLFNGGVFKTPFFQDALLHNLQNWFPEKKISKIYAEDLDLAVCKGAVYYGLAKQGYRTPISGGISRNYYLQLNSASPSNYLTILSKGSEEGTYTIPYSFTVLPNTPIRFPFFSSSQRNQDPIGELIEIPQQELSPLPEMQTFLKYGKQGTLDQIPVRLSVQFTAVGLLELYVKAVNTEHYWKLEFHTEPLTREERPSKAQESRNEIIDQILIKKGQSIVEDFLQGSTKKENLLEILESHFEKSRKDWPAQILRVMGDTLLTLKDMRKKSPITESKWWNLIGFFLRPGYGFPLDDYRMKELWKIYLERPFKGIETEIQTWICMRRVSGGLSKGQQMQLARDLLSDILGKKSTFFSIKKGSHYSYSERLRAAASLEFIEIPLKIQLGEALLNRIQSGESKDFELWALGRVGARELLYGNINNVVPINVCEKWIKQLLSIKKGFSLNEILIQLAKKTGQRGIDISQPVLDQIFTTIQNFPKENILFPQKLALQEQEKIYGDHVPIGLALIQ